MDSAKFLELVKEWIGHPHVIASSDEAAKAMSAQEWVHIGEPCVWVLTESDGTATVWLDYARGNIALAVNGEVSVDIRFISLGNYIALKPEYYGTEGYLYKKV